jgi:hypothetical protein
MYAQSGLLLGITLDIHLGGDSIYIVVFKSLAALASYGSFVIKVCPTIRTWD